MKITVQRETYTDKSTCGEMLIDGEFFCYTLEPPKDRSKGKPYCIPAGTYPLVLQHSPRFDMTTPHVLDVPGFTDIEIHPGNWARDTEGCCLVGNTRSADFVGESKMAFEKLMSILLTGCDITYIG